MSDDLPTAAEVRELLDYDPQTGRFTWKVKVAQNVKAGGQAGGRDARGYWRVKVGGKDRGAHRLAWLYMTGEWPSGEIDHIDGNPGNNAWANLRDVTKSVNQQNQRRAQVTNKSSGVLGVTWGVRQKKWRAVIRYAGKNMHLGYFHALGEAEDAYKTAKRQLHAGCTI